MSTLQLPVDQPADERSARDFRRLLRRRLRVRSRQGSRSRAKGTALAWPLLAVAGLAGWLLLSATVLTGFQEHRTQTVLYSQLREHLAEATVPIGGLIKAGTPVALIDAPAGGIHHQVVVEGTTSDDLTDGPGHLSNSALPGQEGVSVLFGRSATFGAPFRGIASLAAGDEIRVTTGQGTFSYRVDGVREPGDPLPLAVAAGGSRLTLVSSAANGWRSGWAPNHAVFVDATLVGKTKPSPAGRPVAVSAAALPMKGDASAWVPLVFWLQALVLVLVAGVWARARWGGWQTWIVGIPVVLALLWGASNAAILIAPNLT